MIRHKTLFFQISTIILLSLLLKLYFARICALYIWGDTGVIGLIAKQILKGEFPLFFYGHFYMGVLESWIIAPFFFLFGISSYTIHLGPIFVSCLFLISAYFLGKELLDYKTGLIALTYCAIPPFYLFKEGVIPLGYHIEMLLCGNLIFLLTLKIAGNVNYVKGIFYYCLLGIVSGLGFWNNYLVLYYLVPAVIFLGLNLLLRKKYIYLLCGGTISLLFFFIGGAHFWIFNLTHDFASFKFPPMRSPGFLVLFKKILSYHLPGIMGFENNILTTITICIYTVSALFFIFMRNCKKWLFIILTFAMIYFLTRNEYYALNLDYRYLLPVFSVIPFMLAFFVDRLNKKIRFSGTAILFLVIAVNALQIYKGFFSSEKEYLRDGNKYNGMLKFFEKNGITGIYGGFTEVGTINFIGQDKIYAAEVVNSSAPFDTEVQAAVRTAYLEGNKFKQFFDMACKSYKVQRVEGYDINYDFKQWDYYGNEIRREGWKASSNYNPLLAEWAFDENLDRYWSSITPMKTGMYYEIEFPQVYSIYKFQIFNMPSDDTHLPRGYKVLVSKDGINWELVSDCDNPQCMICSGPNIIWPLLDTWLEVIFHPVEARFIRIEQTGESKYPWQINEILFYEYKEDKEFKTRDYVKGAKDIYYFLKDKSINFVYAGYWLSAKMKVLSKGKIGVLGIFNQCWPDRKNISRILELDKDRVLIVEKQNKEGCDRILTEFELPYRKMIFGDYVCYYFVPKTEKDDCFLNKQRSLYWIGTTICRINLRRFGEILVDYGEYLKAVKYFPLNPSLRNKLLEIYREKGLKDLYEKEKQFIRHRFTPKIKKYARFNNGIEFLGLDIENLTGRKYRINYYWRLPENLKIKTFVFVHFLKDKTIVFQNDHPLLEQYVRFPILLPDEIWKESYILEFPKGIDPYLCTKRIGLWIPVGGDERIKITGSKKSYIEIGKN